MEMDPLWTAGEQPGYNAVDEGGDQHRGYIHLDMLHGLTVGVLRETQVGETRVALTPEDGHRLMSMGFVVSVESGAGDSAGFSDSDYRNRDMRPEMRDRVLECQIILCIHPPLHEKLMKDGGILVCANVPSFESDDGRLLLSQLSRARRTLLSLDCIPPCPSFSHLDVSRSQERVAGYQAVIKAVPCYGHFLAGAGGTPPCKVLIIGASETGLEAMRCAKRLGATVSVYDADPSQEKVVSGCGCRFLFLPSHEVSEVTGTYAGADFADEDFIVCQRDFLRSEVQRADVVITCATHDDKGSLRAPLLLCKTTVQKMRAGSVVIDACARVPRDRYGVHSGNVELGHRTEEHTVEVLHGPGEVQFFAPRMPLETQLPTQASRLWSEHTVRFLQHFVDSAGGVPRSFVVCPPSDELAAATAVVLQGHKRAAPAPAAGAEMQRREEQRKRGEEAELEAANRRESAARRQAAAWTVALAVVLGVALEGHYISEAVTITVCGLAWFKTVGAVPATAAGALSLLTAALAGLAVVGPLSVLDTGGMTVWYASLVCITIALLVGVTSIGLVAFRALLRHFTGSTPTCAVDVADVPGRYEEVCAVLGVQLDGTAVVGVGAGLASRHGIRSFTSETELIEWQKGTALYSVSRHARPPAWHLTEVNVAVDVWMFLSDLTGKGKGVETACGVTLAGCRVVSVREGGKAAYAGVAAGWVLVAVEEQHSAASSPGGDVRAIFRLSSRLGDGGDVPVAIDKLLAGIRTNLQPPDKRCTFVFKREAPAVHRDALCLPTLLFAVALVATAVFGSAEMRRNVSVGAALVSALLGILAASSLTAPSGAMAAAQLSALVALTDSTSSVVRSSVGRPQLLACLVVAVLAGLLPPALAWKSNKGRLSDRLPGLVSSMLTIVALHVSLVTSEAIPLKLSSGANPDVLSILGAVGTMLAAATTTAWLVIMRKQSNFAAAELAKMTGKQTPAGFEVKVGLGVPPLQTRRIEARKIVVVAPADSVATDEAWLQDLCSSAGIAIDPQTLTVLASDMLSKGSVLVAVDGEPLGNPTPQSVRELVGNAVDAELTFEGEGSPLRINVATGMGTIAFFSLVLSLCVNPVSAGVVITFLGVPSSVLCGFFVATGVRGSPGSLAAATGALTVATGAGLVIEGLFVQHLLVQILGCMLAVVGVANAGAVCRATGRPLKSVFLADVGAGREGESDDACRSVVVPGSTVRRLCDAANSIVVVVGHLEPTAPPPVPQRTDGPRPAPAAADSPKPGHRAASAAPASPTLPKTASVVDHLRTMVARTATTGKTVCFAADAAGELGAGEAFTLLAEGGVTTDHFIDPDKVSDLLKQVDLCIHIGAAAGSRACNKIPARQFVQFVERGTHEREGWTNTGRGTAFLCEEDPVTVLDSTTGTEIRAE